MSQDHLWMHAWGMDRVGARTRQCVTGGEQRGRGIRTVITLFCLIHRHKPLGNKFPSHAWVMTIGSLDRRELAGGQPSMWALPGRSAGASEICRCEKEKEKTLAVFLGQQPSHFDRFPSFDCVVPPAHALSPLVSSVSTGLELLNHFFLLGLASTWELYRRYYYL